MITMRQLGTGFLREIDFTKKASMPSISGLRRGYPPGLWTTENLENSSVYNKVITYIHHGSSNITPNFTQEVDVESLRPVYIYQQWTFLLG